MIDRSFSLEPMGDRGIIATFREEPSPELTTKMMGFCAAARRLHGVLDASPGHRKVLVELSAEDRDRVSAELAEMEVTPQTGSQRLHRLDCVYDGEDLEWASDFLGLDPAQIVELHSKPEYVVVTLGSPGFVYLSGVDPMLCMPRMERPRLGVPAGAVGIGGKQTGIYGKARPGGWRLIGRVEIPLPEVLPGDRLRFHPS